MDNTFAPCPCCNCELELKSDGEIPNYCYDCGGPTLFNVPKQQVLCPTCGAERWRTKAGNLANFCSNCSYNFSEGVPAADTRSKTSAPNELQTPAALPSTRDQTNPVKRLDDRPSNMDEDDLIVKSFMDLKDKVDEANKIRVALAQSKGEKFSTCPNLTEEELSHLSGVSEALWSKDGEYQKFLKDWSISKKETDTVKVMRNQYNIFTPKLKEIFEKFSIEKTEVEQLLGGGNSVAKSKKQNHAPHVDIKSPSKKCVTFIAVLSSQVKKLFEKLEQPPVLKILSNIGGHGWMPIVELKTSSEDGVWMATIELEPLTCMLYKYVIYIGQEPIYEWLGADSHGYYKNRNLDVSELPSTADVYDGLVDLSSDPSIFRRVETMVGNIWKILSGSSNMWSEGSELADGLKAMLPSWIDCIQSGAMTIQEITFRVEQVFSRQQHRFSYFNSCSHNKWDSIYRQLDELYSEYLQKCIGQHIQATTVGILSPAAACASLVGILYMICHTSYPSTLANPTDRFAEVIKFTIQRITEPQDFSMSLISSLHSNQSLFLSKLLADLLAIAFQLQKDGAHKYIWICLIPIIHVLTGVAEIDQGQDYNTEWWWGVVEIQGLVNAMQESRSSSGEWNIWYTWLKPFFPTMHMLPYTFLALLTADQLHNLLEKADHKTIDSLPLDGVLACALYHLKSLSPEGKGNVIDKLLKFVELKAKMAQTASCSFDNLPLTIVQMIFHQIISNGYKTWLKNPGPFDRGIFSAMGIYLLLLDARLTAEKDLNVEDKGSHLKNFCDQLNAAMTNTFNFTWNSGSEPTSAFDYEKLGSLELKLWVEMFGCLSYCSNDKLRKWWIELRQSAFKVRLLEATKTNQLMLVNLYCNNDFAIPEMEEVIVESALSIAEEILGQLELWNPEDDSQMGILRNVVRWGNFIPVLKFFHSLTESEQKSISDQNVERLLRSSTAVEYVLKQVIDGSICFADFQFLSGVQDKLIELCEVTDDLKGTAERELLNQSFIHRQHQLQKYTSFIRDFGYLWGAVRFYVKGTVILVPCIECDSGGIAEATGTRSGSN